jgi:hypothetical protein
MRSSSSTSSFRRWLLAVVGLAALLVLGGALASEVLIRTMVEDVDYFDAHVRYAQRTRAPDAVFGDSLAARGFHGMPDYAKLAFAGERPKQMLLKAQGYSRETGPRRVIVEAGLSFFDVRDSHPDDGHGYDRIFLRMNDSPLRILRSHHRAALRRYWWVLLGKGEFDPADYLSADGEVMSLNENVRYLQISPEERRAEARSTFANYFQQVEFKDNPNMRHYVALLRFLRGAGADVCILVFPASDSFLAVVRGQPEYDRMMDVYRQLSQQEGARFVNMHGQFAEDANYLDGTHIRPAAARQAAPEAVRQCFGAVPPSAR